MPVTLEPCENGRVLCLTLSDPYRPADVLALMPEDIAYRDRAPHKVHTLIDVRRARSLPVKVLEAQERSGFDHPNSGHFVIVGANRLVQFAAEAAARLAGFERFKFFQTPDDGLRFLREVIAREDGEAGR